MDTEQIIRVGVGITIIKDGKVLLGMRKNAHGAGQWATPGGHLEYMESFTDCVLRELSEECGVEVQNIRFQYLANMKEYKPRHYCHIGMIAEWKSGEPKVLEPEKCEEWRWFDLNEIPKEIFVSSGWAIDALKEGFVFKDAK